MITANEISATTLSDLVRKYQVCWEVWPEYVMLYGKKEQVGFELELSGTHADMAHLSPGCQECRKVFAALVEIADWILPKDKRPTRYEFQPYETRILYAQARDYRPDVTLSIKLLHRENFFSAVDPCEERCLAEIQQKLRELGGCQRLWSRRREQV